MARTLEQEVNLSRRACWKHFSSSEDDRTALHRKITTLNSRNHVCLFIHLLHDQVMNIHNLFFSIKTEKLQTHQSCI